MDGMLSQARENALSEFSGIPAALS